MPLTIKPSSGSGSVTIAATTGTTTNDTLTLPAKTGNIITSADSGTVTAAMLASGAAKANFGAGAVLQVINAIYNTQTSTSSSTFADTGLSASITPASASSKILVLVDLTATFKSTNDTAFQARLVRGSTAILAFENVAGRTSSTLTQGMGAISCNYLDSPSTTASTTYKVQFASANNNANIAINQDNVSYSTITLMEIAG